MNEKNLVDRTGLGLMKREFDPFDEVEDMNSLAGDERKLMENFVKRKIGFEEAVKFIEGLSLDNWNSEEAERHIENMFAHSRSKAVLYLFGRYPLPYELGDKKFKWGFFGQKPFMEILLCGDDGIRDEGLSLLDYAALMGKSDNRIQNELIENVRDQVRDWMGFNETI